MKLYKAGLTVFFAGAMLFSAPLSTYAAEATFFGPIVPVECKCENVPNAEVGTISTAPDYGCVLQVLQNVVNFTLTIGVILFVLYMVVTGFTFMMSGSNPETRNKAKTRFMNVFVGLVVLLCAWLVIDYVMKTLSKEDAFFGPWNAILAGEPGVVDQCIIATKPKGIISGTIAIIKGEDQPLDPATTQGVGFEGTKFTYQPGISNQRPHVSAKLAGVLSCMEGKLPKGVGQISSISDSRIVAGTKSFAQCAQGGCAHAANSCHYGGRACVGSSYAVDFGDEKNKTALISAAKACKAEAIDEGDHVHVSIGASAGCGCSI